MYIYNPFELLSNVLIGNERLQSQFVYDDSELGGKNLKNYLNNISEDWILFKTEKRQPRITIGNYLKKIWLLTKPFIDIIPTQIYEEKNSLSSVYQNLKKQRILDPWFPKTEFFFILNSRNDIEHTFNDKPIAEHNYQFLYDVLRWTFWWVCKKIGNLKEVQKEISDTKWEEEIINYNEIKEEEKESFFSSDHLIAPKSYSFINYIMNALKSHNHFFIPNYQRSYDWGEREIDMLFSDMEDTYKNKDGKHGIHYLGVIGTSHFEKKDQQKMIKIIDGQQRVTTFLILLRCFFVFCLKSNINIKELKEFWEITVNRQIYDNDSWGFSSFVDEKECFLEILKTKKTNLSGDSSFAKNYNYIYKKLENLATNIKKNDGTFENLFEKLKEKILIIDVIYNNESINDFEVFTSLNSKGKTLTVLDLMKSYLLSTANHSDQKEINKYWSEEIIAFFSRNKWKSLSSSMKKTILNTFLENYFIYILSFGENAQYKNSILQDLLKKYSKFELFKKYIQKFFILKKNNSIKQYIQIINTIKRMLVVYTWIKSGTFHMFDNLKRFGFPKIISLHPSPEEIIQPLFFIMENFGEYRNNYWSGFKNGFTGEGLNKFFQFFVELKIKYTLFEGSGGRFKDPINKILDDKKNKINLLTIQDQLVHFRNKLLKEYYFLFPFLKQKNLLIKKLSQEIVNNTNIRPVLCLLESFLKNHSQTVWENAGIMFAGENQVEHILPRKIKDNSDYWEIFREDGSGGYLEFTDRLGNLILLQGKINNTLKNCDFIKKRDHEEGYSQKITAMIAYKNKKQDIESISEVATWNQNQIEKRSNIYASIVCNSILSFD